MQNEKKECSMKLLQKLLSERSLEKAEFAYLIENRTIIEEELFRKSKAINLQSFQRKIFVRGLIEISSYCRNDCYYCGIRRSNRKAKRYRLSNEEILSRVKLGTEIGFMSFVLQGGEDAGFTEEALIEAIKGIKKINPKAALTLSVGEKSFDTLKAYKEAGADRFLLRHETRNREHYYKLHPKEMSQDFRLQTLKNLKALGYQTGSGIMVGSPGQTAEHIAEDLLFLRELNPEMIGIGPFVPAKGTPFENEANGSAELTVFILGILRIMFPHANLPATTSLATLSKPARDKAIDVAANVYMPNLTPNYRRREYNLYDDKACFEMEAAENLDDLKKIMKNIGYRVVMDRGDYRNE
ncbi:MAG: [FeFe] hydrogenase H-cluster radical SAM maturase HydE [Eubacterium sp.]|nr:[FeFe] hydrogenase H-cluster radical SAM maturase HydE [Eubacterium sp.]